MLIAFAPYSNAQQAATPSLDIATPVSKPAFKQKVDQLDKLISESKTADANNKFQEISNLINDELKVVRYQMRDAKTETERKAAVTQTQKQRGLYAEIMTLRADMTTNRVALKDKLNEFADTIQ